MTGRKRVKPIEAGIEICFDLNKEFGNKLCGREDIIRLKVLLKENIDKLQPDGILKIDFFGIVYVEPLFCHEIALRIMELRKQYMRKKQLKKRFILLCNVPQELLPNIAAAIDRNRIAVWVQLETGRWIIIGKKVSLVLWKFLEGVVGKGVCSSNEFVTEFNESLYNCSRSLKKLFNLGLIEIGGPGTSHRGKRLIFKRIKYVEGEIFHWELRKI